MAAPSALLEFCWGKDNSGKNLIRGSITAVKNFNGKFYGNTTTPGSSITFYGENSGQIETNFLASGSISIQNFSGQISENSLYGESFIDLTASSEVSGSISLNNLVTSTVQVLSGSFSGSCTNNDLSYSAISFVNNSTRTINRSSISGVPVVIDDADINYSFIQVNQFDSGFIKDLDMGTSSVYSGTTLTIPSTGGVSDNAWVGTFNLINSNGKNITNIQNTHPSTDYHLTIKFTTEAGSTVSFTPTSISSASSGDIVMESLSPITILGRSIGGDYILFKVEYASGTPLIYKVGGSVLA